MLPSKTHNCSIKTFKKKANLCLHKKTQTNTQKFQRKSLPKIPTNPTQSHRLPAIAVFVFRKKQPRHLVKVGRKGEPRMGRGLPFSSINFTWITSLGGGFPRENWGCSWGTPKLGVNHHPGPLRIRKTVEVVRPRCICRKAQDPR